MKKYKVLYTHHKQKKRKTWQDGCLILTSDSKKGQLFDDHGTLIDSLFLKTGQVNYNIELESEKYLITIENEDDGNENNEQDVQNEFSTTKDDSQQCAPRAISTGDQTAGHTLLESSTAIPQHDVGRKRNLSAILSFFEFNQKPPPKLAMKRKQSPVDCLHSNGLFHPNKPHNEGTFEDTYFDCRIDDDHGFDLNEAELTMVESSMGLANNSCLSKESIPNLLPTPHQTAQSQSVVAVETVTKQPSFSPPVCNGISKTTFVFPNIMQCLEKEVPMRRVNIPTEFESVLSYKRCMKSLLVEHMNILLFTVANKYHTALYNADVSSLSDAGAGVKTNVPICKHGAALLRVVRKNGKNKGRMFFTCSSNEQDRCKFFVWANDTKNFAKIGAGAKTKLCDSLTAMSYFSGRGVELYVNVKFIRKNFHSIKKHQGIPRASLFLVLPTKKSASCYGKEDIWIVSKAMDFGLKETFIALSVFYGPNSNAEVEIKPLSGYSQSNWKSNETCVAIQACNVSTEITCLMNMDERVNPIDVPVLKHLIMMRASTVLRVDGLCLPSFDVMRVLDQTALRFNLNDDQRSAMESVAGMFIDGRGVSLIHGVFGAGKSYLLSCMVVFLSELFTLIHQQNHGGLPVKLLISSTTNVAVDRVLHGLLDIGFESFVRVGSVKKISKRVLPHAVHANEAEDIELRELNELMKEQVSEKERSYVRKAIEHHKLGVNRKKLAHVNVVGVTCAACVFPCLKDLVFQVQLLDEASQIIEPLSMLPVSLFHCQRLVLVGDPRQLGATVKGTVALETCIGLEQSLFDRLRVVTVGAVLLRTQYRCHPHISSLSNALFYGGQLIDGVTEEQRQPLVGWMPTLAFVDVNNGTEKYDFDGSYTNMEEARFVVQVLSALLTCDVKPSDIGVITQYKSQVFEIAKLMQGVSNVQISTVDAFQGAEKEVILLSCVRTRHIGFIDCPRRTNVALTRAKRHLIIAGNYNLLATNACWSRVWDVCKKRNGFVGKVDEFMKLIEMFDN